LSKLSLTLACGDYEIVRALVDGKVMPEGVDLNVLTEMDSTTRHWRFLRNREFDAAEISCNGNRVVFAGALVETLNGMPLTRICSTELSGGETRVLTSGANNDRSPKFSPDGMRIAFLSVATAVVVGGAFLSGTVLPNHTKGVPAPRRTIAEGPPLCQPPGWSCDGSNWIFFDQVVAAHAQISQTLRGAGFEPAACRRGDRSVR